MGDKSKIEWCDATWNPVTGCSKVSSGCAHCYAEAQWPRMQHLPGYAGRSFGDVRCHEDRLGIPLRWKRPRRIFVNSMSDLFHEEVPRDFIVKVFAAMLLSQRHTFQILTKRSSRMREILGQVEDTFEAEVRAEASRMVHDRPTKDLEAPWPLPNVWLGVSVEDQKAANQRVPDLAECRAAVRFLSCEPLLGSLDLEYPKEFFPDGPDLCCSGYGCGCMGMPSDPPLLYGIDWVIVGGESGGLARPMHPEWARSIMRQCQRYKWVSFLFKQWGEWSPEVSLARPRRPRPGIAHDHSTGGGTPVILLDTDGMERDTNELNTFSLPCEWVRMAKVGKKNAGNHLDGRQHLEYPEHDGATK